MPAPKLTFWQKLLKAVGLYTEPTRPPRPERRPDAAPSPKKEREPRRNKTRDARTESSPSSKEESPKRDEKRRDRSPSRDKRPRGGDPSTVENRRVYVGNLSYDTTESDLEELFKGVGAVRRVEIVYNRKTHRSKGYGFIEMIDIDEAKRTVEVLHDQHFMGRQLTVSGAKSKDYEDAENEEGEQSTATQEMPPLAPKNPAKEQVLDLLEAPETDKVSEAVTEEAINEIPTEEFSHENNTQGESENEVKS